MNEIRAIVELADHIEQSVKELQAKLDLYRESFAVTDRLGKKVSEAEAFILRCISEQADPAFRCDLLRPADIADAIYRIDPSLGERFTPMRVGHFMRKMGRFPSARMSSNSSSYRVWVIRNYDEYLPYGGSFIYKEYEQQLKDNVPNTLPRRWGEVFDDDEEDEPETPDFAGGAPDFF